MYKTTLTLTLLLFFVLTPGKAQKNDFAHYDSLTYKLYLDKE